MIEFALVLPLLLLLSGGACDLGIFMFQREQAASCVRTVARKAALRTPTAMTVSDSPQCQKASDEGGFGLDPAGFDYMNAPAGSDVTVEVDYTYDPIFLDMAIPGWGSIATMQVVARVTMRMEAQAAT